MKILQICNFSSGISGVWTRVLEDSLEFVKRGHDVFIFSSDKEENGQEAMATEVYPYDGIRIRRFPIKRKVGYAIWFDFVEEALKLKPDVIICHGLRKPYLGPAIKIAKKLGIKCFLITHAPFVDKELRAPGLNFAIWFYDKVKGRKMMNSFDKVLAVCKWEKEDLLRLGCEEERIVYVPNSLSEEFFNQKPGSAEKKILFMGRMHPVKEIETLMIAFLNSNLRDAYKLEIVSSLNGKYYKKLEGIKKDFEKHNQNIFFTNELSLIKDKIDKIDSAEIFVLPSKKESLPFGIIEAMSRGKIVIATKTKGALELIKDGENGFLFDIGNIGELRVLLNNILEMSEERKNQVRQEAMITSQEFRISNIMNKWEGLLK